MSAVGMSNVSSAEVAGAPEAPTIKRMIDRFRHASPTSREDRAFIDPNAKPDFWWTKIAPGSGSLANASFASQHNVSYTGAASGRMDQRAGVASFLSDTAPASYTYRGGLSNVLGPHTGRNSAVAPSAAENDLSLLTSKLFARNVPADSSSTGPSAWMSSTEAEGRPAGTRAPTHLPASAAIVAEDLDQALAGFRRRYSVDREKQAKPRLDEYGYEIEDDEDEEGERAQEDGGTGRAGTMTSRGRELTRQHELDSGVASRSRSASANDSRHGSSRRLQFSATTGSAGGESEDVPGQRAALARAQALTGALRGMGTSRPPSGRASLNVSSSSEHAVGGPEGVHAGVGVGMGAGAGSSSMSKEEARRRRLSNALSSLAEGLDVSMLTLSRKLASMSGDAGSLVDTGAAILASAAGAGRAREDDEGGQMEHTRGSAALFASSRGPASPSRPLSALDTLAPVVTELPMYAGGGTGAASALLSSPDRMAALSRGVGSPSRLPVSPPSRSPVRASRAGVMAGSVSPLSPRQQQVQMDWRNTWKVEAGEQVEGAENMPQPVSTAAEDTPSVPARATAMAEPGPPTPSMTLTASSTQAAGAGVRRQPSALELLEAAMRGDAAAFVSALEGKPSALPVEGAASSEGGYSEAHAVGNTSRASRMTLSLEPTGKLSPGLMKSLTARRMSGASALAQAAPATAAPPAPAPAEAAAAPASAPTAAAPAAQAAVSEASAATGSDPSPAASTTAAAVEAPAAPLAPPESATSSGQPAPAQATAPAALPQHPSDDLNRLTVTNAAGVSSSLSAGQLLGSGGGMLNFSLTAPGSSFIPLTAFIPPPAKPRAVLGADGNPLLIGAASDPLSGQREGLTPALHAAYSLPSVWGRPPAPRLKEGEMGVDGQPVEQDTGPLLPGVDLSALQAQALEATLGFGATVPPVMHPYTGVTPGRAGRGYVYQAPPPAPVPASPLPPAGAKTTPALPPGAVAIPAELAPVFAAFLEEHVAQHGYIPLATGGGQSPRQEQATVGRTHLPAGMPSRPAQPVGVLSPVSPPTAPMPVYGGSTGAGAAAGLLGATTLLPRASSFPVTQNHPPSGTLRALDALGRAGLQGSQPPLLPTAGPSGAMRAGAVVPSGPTGAAYPLPHMQEEVEAAVRHHWPPALPEYSGPVPLWPEAEGGVGQRAGSFDSLPPFPNTGRLLHGEYGGTPPAAPGDVTGAWPTASLPAHVSLSSGLPTGRPLPLPLAIGAGTGTGAGAGMVGQRGAARHAGEDEPSVSADPVTSAPSGVARQVDSLLSTHEELTRRAAAVLGMGPLEIAQAQAQRVALINAQAQAEAQVADARKRAAAAPSSYDSSPIPSSLTVEAQVTFKRAQAALEASARLRAMLAGSQGPPSQAISPATMDSQGYVGDTAGDGGFGESDGQGGGSGQEGGEDYVDLSGYRG